MGMSGVSKSQMSRLREDIDQRVKSRTRLMILNTLPGARHRWRRSASQRELLNSIGYPG